MINFFFTLLNNTGESSTIGGLLCAEAGRIPRAGDQIPFAQYLFTVLEVEDNRLILNVGAKLLDPTASDADSYGVNAGAGAGAGAGGWERDTDNAYAEGQYDAPSPSGGRNSGGSGYSGSSSNANRNTPMSVSGSLDSTSSISNNNNARSAASVYDPSSFAPVLGTTESNSSDNVTSISSAAAVRGKRAFVDGTWIEEWLNATDDD